MKSIKYLPLTTRFQVSNSIFSSYLEEETVILNLQSGTYFGLDKMGTLIFGLLEKYQSLEEIRKALMADYEVSKSDCEQAIQGIVQDLLEAKLIEIKSEQTV